MFCFSLDILAIKISKWCTSKHFYLRCAISEPYNAPNTHKLAFFYLADRKVNFTILILQEFECCRRFKVYYSRRFNLQCRVDSRYQSICLNLWRLPPDTSICEENSVIHNGWIVQNKIIDVRYRLCVEFNFVTVFNAIN